MSRDPLEGYRPSDTGGPPVSLGPPVSFEPATLPGPVSSGTSVRGSRTRMMVLVFIGSLIAVLGGAVAYFVSIPHTPFPPKTQPSAKVVPAGEVVVTQGPRPPDAPSPEPTATPK